MKLLRTYGAKMPLTMNYWEDMHVDLSRVVAFYRTQNSPDGNMSVVLITDLGVEIIIRHTLDEFLEIIKPLEASK